jgi:hypothetical protein
MFDWKITAIVRKIMVIFGEHDHPHLTGCMKLSHPRLHKTNLKPPRTGNDDFPRTGDMKTDEIREAPKIMGRCFCEKLELWLLAIFYWGVSICVSFFGLTERLSFCFKNFETSLHLSRPWY